MSMRLTSMQQVLQQQQAHQPNTNINTESVVCRQIGVQLSHMFNRIIENLNILLPHKSQNKLSNPTNTQQLILNVQTTLCSIFTKILDEKQSPTNKTDKEYHELQKIVQKAQSDIRGYLANQNALKLYVEELNQEISYLDKKLKSQLQSYAKLQAKYSELQRQIHQLTKQVQHQQQQKGQYKPNHNHNNTRKQHQKLPAFCMHTKAISQLKLTQSSQSQSRIDSRTQPLSSKKRTVPRQRQRQRQKSRHNRMASQMTSSNSVFQMLSNKIVVKLQPKQPIHATKSKILVTGSRQLGQESGNRRIKTQTNRKESNSSVVRHY